MHAQKMCVKVKQQMENTKTKHNLECVCERKNNHNQIKHMSFIY